MKWSCGYRMRSMLVGFIAAIVLGGIELASGATITVGRGEAIQAGIDAANDTDTVLVAPGEYVITVPITFRGKAITVISEAGPDETSIRMGTPADPDRASVVIFENNETAASVLEGFTITGGRGCCRFWDPEESEFDCAGGGILFDTSSGTVRNCAIAQNRAKDVAGGVFIGLGSSAILTQCIISGNMTTDEGGGGMMLHSGSSATLTDCIIGENVATEDSGGGVLCWENSSATLTNCTISENSAGRSGGGVFCGKGSSMTVTGCTIRDNSCLATAWAGGGGVHCYLDSSLTMTDCLIVENYSGCVGGGVFCSDSAASVTVTNCIIAGNTARSGGGLGGWAPVSMAVINCTIWGNSANFGGGMGCFNGASATVTNSILWGNTAPKGPEIHLQKTPTEFRIMHSNVAGGEAGADVRGGSTLDWGAGNIDADPLFARLGYFDDNGTRDSSDDFWVDGDYRLKSQAGRWDPDSQTWVQDDVTSPCIDAGDPMAPINWELFPNGGFVNMGAYGGTPKASKSYFGEPVCETVVAGDINGDGQVNRADLQIMALHWTDEEPLSLP